MKMLLAVASLFTVISSARADTIPADCVSLPHVAAGWYAKDTARYWQYLDRIDVCFGALPRDARYDAWRQELLSAKAVLLYQFSARQRTVTAR